MENLPKTKKLGLITDITLDHTGGWGGALKIIMMIGNFRVIEGIN